MAQSSAPTTSGGVQTQIVKLGYGALDSLTLVSASNGLPVAQQGTWNVGTVTTVTTVSTVTAITDITNPVVINGGAGQTSDIKVTLDSEAVDTELTTADLDTGAGTDTRAVVGIALAASGGAQLLPGDATNGAKVQVAAALPAGTNAIGKLAANSGVDIGDVDILSIAAGDNNIGNVDIVTLPAGNLGQQTMAASLSVVPASNITDATYIGDIKFGEALPAGTNAIGKLAANSGVDIGDVDVLSIAAGANLIGDVGLGVRTSGGVSIFRSIDLDEGTLEVVKGSAGQVYGFVFINTTAAIIYVKFYNATSGTVGTGTPVMTIPIPGNGDSDGAGVALSIPQGIAFSTGICVGASTGVADNDTSAPAANALIAQVFYN